MEQESLGIFEEGMPLLEARKQAAELLEPVSGESAVFEASQLLGEIVGIPGSQLGLYSHRNLSREQAEQLTQWVRRRMDGEPLQYILEEWEFYGLPIQVGPGVLIPRPDTETIVDQVLELLAGKENPVVADLCSGSGAIALAVWSQHPTAQVTAVELSRQALGYLRNNVAAICQGDRPPVQVIEGDVLGKVSLPPLDLLVSNPPYLTPEEMTQLSPEVEREPSMALLGGEDGLLFYREITRQYKTCLKPGGALVYEVGYQQADAVMELLLEAGFVSIGCRKDLAGIRRCVYGVFPG